MDSLIPPIGVLSQAERMFRLNWVSALLRSPGGVPLHRADFVSRQGRAVRLVDVREPDELVGTLGHVPGSDWVHRDHAVEVLSKLDRDTPIIIVSRGGERAGEIALQLEMHGMRLVAAMMGGIVAWRDAGFSISREEAILRREGQLREIPVAAAPSNQHLTEEDVQRHVGDVHSVRWMKLAALLINGRVSCVDGRDDSGVIGTPGGDGGEMVLALVALERLLDKPLDFATIDTLLTRRIDAFGRFYMHTDVAAANTLIASLRSDPRFNAALEQVNDTPHWREFFMTPPADLRSALLEHTMQADHIGCGHIKLMIKRSSDYGLRTQLVLDFLKSFFTNRWAGNPELELAPLPGGHAEGAVLNARLTRGVFAFSSIPLISPSLGGRQAFVNHPDVMAFLRRQLAEWIVLQDDVVRLPAGAAQKLATEMDAIAAVGTGNTLGALAKGLPIYDVEFGNRGITVRAVGHV
jgi:rhodanese-related sulfurtransferase